MKNVSRNSEPTILPKNRQVRNVNEIAASIEKVERKLREVRRVGNKDAISTWKIVRANLQHQWRDAMVEIHSRNNYYYQ